ncbi:MAG: hypothetical protein JHC88_21850 [Niveispirillum sp.]|nr:hypothetical protein [Niveispirillum sp.]
MKSAAFFRGADLVHDAIALVKERLSAIPIIRLDWIEPAPMGIDAGFDIIVEMDVAGRSRQLACEIKSRGEPSIIMSAIFRLKRNLNTQSEPLVPVVIAPYLSSEARNICRENSVGYFDFFGNAYLALDEIYIERELEGRPTAERRELKSLFKPKSARILRILLRDPGRSWRVTELADVAKVSLGQVSNVRGKLIEREWASVTPDGVRLIRPDALLDDWRNGYEAPTGPRLEFHTTLHGPALERALADCLCIRDGKGVAALASFSAAKWLAPYGRVGSHFLYTDRQGLERLKMHLQLSPAPRGANVVVTLLDDDGPFLDTVEPAPGIICTSAVQTYLDLHDAGERGREAADHLRRLCLKWV